MAKLMILGPRDVSTAGVQDGLSVVGDGMHLPNYDGIVVVCELTWSGVPVDESDPRNKSMTEVRIHRFELELRVGELVASSTPPPSLVVGAPWFRRDMAREGRGNVLDDRAGVLAGPWDVADAHFLAPDTMRTGGVIAHLDLIRFAHFFYLGGRTWPPLTAVGDPYAEAGLRIFTSESSRLRETGMTECRVKIDNHSPKESE